MIRFKIPLLYLTIGYFCFCNQVVALDAAEEYEIKATYLFNLGKFITWSEDRLQEGQPFGICILGWDPFGEDLEFVVQRQKQIHGHQVLINRLSNIKSIADCHILFIGYSEQLSNVFTELKNAPLLTVGDNENFVAAGGMIQFYLHNGKIRLMLDPQTIDEAGLKISSQLMQIASLIKR